MNITYSFLRGSQDPAEFDAGLLWTALLLMAIGLVMVYSASISTAEADRSVGYHSQFYFIRQGFFLFIGGTMGYVMYQFPMRVWQQAAPYLFLLAQILLLLVLIPMVGKEVKGSRRWLPLGVVNLQPSELMKLFVVLYAADYTVRKAAWMHSFRKGFLPMFGVMFAVGVLLIQEPDFGALAVIAAIAMGTLFLGGLNWRLFAALTVLLVVGLLVVAVSSPYRMQRIVWFWEPFKDFLGKGYQLSHSLIAFGRGEWLGVGLGASVEKLFYLPEAHTDFLLAVIGEELGFIGVCSVIALFAWLVWRAFSIGSQAARLERYFSALVAQGIAIWLGTQTVINMGVNLGVLPTKGLTLPFMSFGGSGLVVNCCALALLLRVDYENRQLMRGRPA